MIDLAAALDLAQPVFGGQRLHPGRYLYCGSAHGPGGLAARLHRHLRLAKRPHWHVDQLTLVGRIRAIAAIPGGDECRLLAKARKLPGATVPLPRFGSSDCRQCPAHLLRLPPDLDLVRLDLPWIDLQDPQLAQRDERAVS